MKSKFSHPIFILTALLISLNINASDFKNNFEWNKIQSLPNHKGMNKQMGISAPFSGNINDMVIVAGGSNFPEIAAADGGSKRYYSDIFIFNSKDKKSWKKIGELPYPTAYGASVSLPDGILCIGGKNNEKQFSYCYKIKYNQDTNSVEIIDFPKLPFSLEQMGAAIINNKIYVVGGLRNKELKNNFLCLDLDNQGKENFKWEILPEFPGSARLQPVVVAQNTAEEKCLFLLSGSCFYKDKDTPNVNTDGLMYNPSSKKWENIGNINVNGKNYSLHGGCGNALGVHNIVCIGGINKDVFKDALLNIRKGQTFKNNGDSIKYNEFLSWKYKYLTQNIEDYKFNSDLLIYNTITGKWTVGDKNAMAARAGAAMVPYDNGWLIINGELKPGIRSKEINFIKTEAKPQFGVINWIVLVFYLLSMLYLGYYFMKKEQSTSDFFQGGGRIPWWAAGISIFATMLSAITFMAIPAKVYATNWKYFPMAVTIMIMVFPVVKYYLPFFRRLNVTTAYEYLEKRFNYGTRFLASFLFITFMTARMALVLFLPALALTTVTGINIYLCIILMGVITIIYCTMGGVEAVVWGDVIQGIVLMGGALFAIFFLVSGIDGGMNTVINIAVENDKFMMFDWAFDFTKASVWVVVLGGLANNLISYSSDQTVIQRYMTTKDEKASRRSIMLNGVLSIAVSVVFYFIGTALFAYYTSKPGQMNFSMANPDSIFPHFIMAELPIGLAGLLIAAIFAATMSTISSNINSISTAFTADLFNHFIKADDKKQLKVARLSGAVFGVLGVGLALLMATWNILSLFDYFNYILGLLSSAIGGLFIMGIFFPRIGGKSALIGFITGTAILLYVSIYTNISFLLFGFIGMFLSVLLAWIFSFFIKEEKKDLDGLAWKFLRIKK